MKARQSENFYYELGTLLGAGLPIYQALDLLEKPFKRDGSKLKSSLEQGCSLFESLTRLEGVSKEDALIIRLAEETGMLSEAFLELHETRQQKRELKEKLVSFAVYPLLMLTLIGIYLAFSLFYMVPMMADLLRTLEVDEGFLFTLDTFRILIIRFWYLAVLSVLLTGFLLFIFLFRNGGALKMILGKRHRLYYEIQAIDRMSRLLKGGRGILEVLELTEEIGGIDLPLIRKNLLDGEGLSCSFEKGGFSREFTALIKIHEEGGNLISGFELFLSSSRTSLNHTMEKRIRLLEPLSMIMIGTVVGISVIAIMGPLMDAFGKIK